MTEAIDPFAADPIERDRYDRPLIIPLKRGGVPNLKGKLVPYTRVSTFSGALDDAGGLATWRLWHLALGLGRNEELAAMAGVFGPTVDDLSKADKAELSRIIETAHNRSGGDVKANHGTAIHAMTEPGRDPFIPTRMRESVDLYTAALAAAGLEVVSSEQFVVCDELQTAGTFDHLYRLTRDTAFADDVPIKAGTLLIGDKKTGKLHFDSQAIQLAIYARGKLYDPETGERTNHGGDLTHGVLVHIPKWDGDGPVPPVKLYRVDLTKGWAAAQLAAKVRAHRTDNTLSADWPTGATATVASVPVAEPTPIQPVAAPTAVERVAEAAAAVEAAIEAGPVNPFEADWPTETEPAAEPVVESARIAALLTAPKRDIRAECEATDAKIKAELEAKAAAKAALEADVGESVSDDEAAVMAALSAGLGAKPVVSISVQLERAQSRDELAAIWRANRTAWTPMHTAALQACAAQFPAEPVVE